jgi:DNA-binding NarL/FixJ family response regulator
MPVKGGVAATREIRLKDPKIKVLVLTTLRDDDTVFEAILAGAQGYLLKDVGDSELLEAIRALKRHESMLTPPLARRTLDKFQEDARKLRGGGADDVAPAGAPAASTLSSLEERLLSLLAAGRSMLEAAAALGRSESELRSHLSRIMEKLHANSDAEHLLRTAREQAGRGTPTLRGRP